MEKDKENIKINKPPRTNESNNLRKKIRRFFRLFCFKCFVEKSNCEFCNNCKITINIKPF